MMETETHCLSAFASLLHSAKIEANVNVDAKCEQTFSSRTRCSLAEPVSLVLVQQAVSGCVFS